MRLIDGDKLLDEFDKLDLDYGAMGGVAECIAITEGSPTIEPNKSRPYGDCSKCTHEYGTLGCCTTVSNKWVYDCDNGMAQYEKTKAEPSKSIDQDRADVPSVEREKELCELAQTKKRLLDIGDELIAKLRKYTIPAIAESVHQLDEVDPTSWSKAIQSEKEELALQKAISIIDKIPSVDPSDYMCFSCKYGNRVGMPCKECKHDYEDKYTPINKYGTIPTLDIDLISRESAICAIENTDCELTAWDWDELTDAINKVPSADVVSREEYNKLLANSIWESEHIGKMLEYQNETEPSGDLISREEAIEAIVCDIWHTPAEERPLFKWENYVRAVVERVINRLPSVDLPKDRPKGEWVRYKRCDPVGDEIYAVMEAPDGKFFCNQCGKSAIRSDFCPNCGARMYKGGDQE